MTYNLLNLHAELEQSLKHRKLSIIWNTSLTIDIYYKTSIFKKPYKFCTIKVDDISFYYFNLLRDYPKDYGFLSLIEDIIKNVAKRHVEPHTKPIKLCERCKTVLQDDFEINGSL